MTERTEYGRGSVLRAPGFPALVLLQSFGSVNESAWRTLVSLRAVQAVAAAEGAWIAPAIAAFVLPFVLFSGYSGHLADRIGKRTVLIGVKLFELAVMAFGAAAFASDRMDWMLAVIFLLGVNSTLLGPSKLSIVPELVPEKDLSRANALLQAGTSAGVLLGASAALWLFPQWMNEPWKVGAMTIALSAAGLLASLALPPVPAAAPEAPFRLNPIGEIATGIRRLHHDRPMGLSVAAICYFFFLATYFQIGLRTFGAEALGTGSTPLSGLVVGLSGGAVLGSLLAGWISGDKVELGLVPLGSMGTVIFSAALWTAGSYWTALAAVVLLGASAGLFVVPLLAFLQECTDAGERGRIFATANFLTTAALLAASLAFTLLHDRMGVSAGSMFLIFAAISILATIYIVTVVPDFLLRLVLWMATHTFFKVRIVGLENMPFHGPALIVANHMSHVDGFLISACVARFIRFMVWRPFFEMRPIGWFLRLARAIPVGGGGRRDAVESIRSARKELAGGNVVCIFAEGAITRTGNLLPFKRGLEKIGQGTDAPIIPVHLDRLWGSIFSFEGGRFFWKWPKRFPYPVTVSFGRPLPSTATADEVRSVILGLGADAAAARKQSGDLLPLRFIGMARRHWRRFAMADSSGRELTCGEVLAGSLVVARWIRAHCADQRMLGVVLPASIGGALVNVGTTLAGRVPVNLNFTAGGEVMASAIEQCGIRTVITSKLFLAKAKLGEIPGAVYLEDILARASTRDKALAWLGARLLPARWFDRVYGLGPVTPDDLATVIFSSGSTGVPKGVMLSHYNIISNIEAIGQVYWVGASDCIIGSLPFFHSFGFTVTVWFPLLAGCRVVYHANPADAKAIGALVKKYSGTFLLSTPTFCTNFVRRCSPEEFATLRFVLVGAERLRDSIAESFQEKFGVRPLEGYGCTELAPVVAVNTPDFRAGKEVQVGGKPGTVGHPLPGIAVRIVDPATFDPLPPTGEGLLLVKGPNRMLGYLGRPDLTGQALLDGWYITGDIAAIDDEGFLRITDRLSRFSKIAGEMVPHLKVEEAVYDIIGEFECAVAGVPDEQRGERLVILYTRPDMSPAELWQQLSRRGLPALWVPKVADIHQVTGLATLGTGKLDLRAVKQRARELSAPE